MSVIIVTVSVLLTTFAITESGKTNVGKIVFPESPETLKKETQEIPLDLVRRLNEVSDVEDLFKNLMEPIQSENRSLLPIIAARIGSENVERNALQEAKMAKCMPEVRTVPLNPDKTTATFYYPSCTRVERCGGCCSHHLLSCQPIESEIIPMSVVVADYLGGSKLQFRERKIVEVEQHTKCKCDCKIRQEDCNRYQKYNQDKCQCECANSDEERKCILERAKKIWNKTNCSCMCKEELECGSGFYFDPFTCSCVPYRSRKKPNYAYNVN